MENQYIKLQKEIQKKLLKSNGRLNRYAYDKFPNLIKLIIKATGFLSNDSGIKERVYCINNFVYSQPLCELCKKPVTFKSNYTDTCSMKCNNTIISRNTAKQRSETLKQNNKEKLYNLVLSRFNKMNEDNDYELINIDITNKIIKFKCLTCNEINTKSFTNFKHYTYCTSKPCKVKRINHNFKDPKFLELCKQKNLEKNGNKNYSNREQFKETCLEKYNETHYMKNDSFKQRFKDKNLKEFYNEKILSLPDIKPLFKEYEYKGVSYVYSWECKVCSSVFNGNLSSGKTPLCRVCNPTQYTSKVELEIREWIYTFFKKEDVKVNWKSNKEGVKFEIDILIESKKIGIELNGVYWHSELGGLKDKNYHKNKSEFYKKYFDYQIIHIWDIEWINKKDLIKSILKSKLGLINRKIYARKCVIKEVNNLEKKDFLDTNHLQGNGKSSVKLGLYFDEELVSLLTLGKSRFNKKYEYEIIRYCSELDTSVVGGFSRLLKHFIKTYNSKSIITYADNRYSNGNLYLNNGFKFLHKSNSNYFYTLGYKILESRVKYQKHKLKDILINFDESLSEWENMKNNKFDRIWDCGNLVFEYIS